MPETQMHKSTPHRPNRRSYFDRKTLVKACFHRFVGEWEPQPSDDVPHMGMWLVLKTHSHDSFLLSESNTVHRKGFLQKMRCTPIPSR